MSSRVRVLATAAVAAAVLAGCTAAGGHGTAHGNRTGEPVATTTVDLPKSYRFDPATITVPAGSTVTWTNSDDFSHTVRLLGEGLDVGLMKPGERISHTFRAPGTYRYDCSLHPQNMTGTVVVTGTAP